MAQSESIPRRIEDRWLSLSDAARRCGQSERNLRRLCGDQWLAKGLARLTQNPGTRPAWEINEAADPKLAIAPAPETLSQQFDLRTLTDTQRDMLLARERAVQDWDRLLSQLAAGNSQLTADLATEHFLQRLDSERGLKISRATLHRWRAAWRAQGVKGLVDERWTKSVGSAGSAEDFGLSESIEHLKRLYLDPRKRSVRLCLDIATEHAIQQNRVAPSYKKAQRIIAALDPQLVMLKRFGKKAFEDKCEVSIMRDYTTIASNEVWCGDHHRFDVMVQLGTRTNRRTGEIEPVIGRPWITGWLDMRSRKIVGYAIFGHDPNTDTILRAFVEGAKEHGLPSIAYVDNGKDYDSAAIQGITKRQRLRAQVGIQIDEKRLDGAFGLLDVQVKHAWPYHGQSKPIERFFGTLCGRFSKLWDTYCGKDTASKPENLKAAIAAGKAPPLPQFIEQFSAWVHSDYHLRAHGGQGMDGLSPAVIWEQCLGSKRVVAPEILAFAAMPRFERTVDKNGVTHRGLHYGGNDDQVVKQFGRKVLVSSDPSDATRLIVCDLQNRFIGVAHLNIGLGVNAAAEDVREAAREKRRLKKTLSDYDAARPKLSMMDDPHRLLQDAAIRSHEQRKQLDGGGSDAPPPSIRPHRTPFDADLPELKRAVGDGVTTDHGPRTTDQSQLTTDHRPLTTLRFDYQSHGSDPANDDSESSFAYEASHERSPD